VISRRELLLAAGAAAVAPARSVAITIDDLPRAGDWPADSPFEELLALNRDFLAPFRSGKLPLTGLATTGRWLLGPDQLDRILRLWLEAGAELGNHTHTHPDLNTAALGSYQADILACDRALRRVTKPRFFRHPFLHAGPDKSRRGSVEDFLTRHGYRIAPVTLDNSDYLFATAYGHALARGDEGAAARFRAAYLPYLESIFAFFEKRSTQIFGREIPQVLLLHVSRLNADAMPEILAMTARRGYRIIALEEALADRAYASRDEYYGPGGFSWIHRWSKTMGLPPRGEPSEPAFVREEFERLRRR
jgi:peptidoglycan/xylan/chitin deacetylase (PgdA/CDA1 family)